MRQILLWLAVVSMTAHAAGDEKASPLASLEVEKSRVQGNWQVRCEIDHPAQAETEASGKLLEQACRSAAARFSVRSHTEKGGLYRQEVGVPKSNKDRSKLAIEILLRKQ